MNATATRSAAKTAATAKTKSASKNGKPPLTKPDAGKLAKGISSALKPASKSLTAAAKSVAKPVKSTVKSSAASPAKKNAARNSTAKAAVEKTTSARTRASSAESATRGSSGATPATRTGLKEASEASMSRNNSSNGLRDKMGQPAVSKASEVATKTSKSSQPAAAGGALLTEEQILKMSEKDYMNEAQLAFFKARLQQLERDLLRNAGETTEHLRETVLVPDPADRATIEEEHALELRTRDRERKLLKKVQQSIASIDAGEYGWCEETGEPIGIPRLLARPTATLSLEAQQRRELKQKLYGD
jgi:DnaK suppressor protein